MPGIADREYHKVAPVPSTGRPSIYELRQPEIDLGAWLDDQLPALRGARVLDAGCGPGMYVPFARERAGWLVALDIAQGRLWDVDHPARVCGDVETIPFADDTFDVVMAMHMLYHVRDIRAGVGEMRRVLRDGGVLYAFTNSERAQWELHELYIRAGGGDAAVADDARFCNENGSELLATAFDHVELIEDTSTRLVVTDVECVIDELQRNRYIYDVDTHVPWDELIDSARLDAQAVIDRDGAFVMSENHGLFTCR